MRFIKDNKTTSMALLFINHQFYNESISKWFCVFVNFSLNRTQLKLSISTYAKYSCPNELILSTFNITSPSYIYMQLDVQLYMHYSQVKINTVNLRIFNKCFFCNFIGYYLIL